MMIGIIITPSARRRERRELPERQDGDAVDEHATTIDGTRSACRRETRHRREPRARILSGIDAAHDTDGIANSAPTRRP